VLVDEVAAVFDSEALLCYIRRQFLHSNIPEPTHADVVQLQKRYETITRADSAENDHRFILTVEQKLSLMKELQDSPVAQELHYR
jgi:hypothetical protein